MTPSGIRFLMAFGCVLLAIAIAGEAVAAHALAAYLEPALVDRFERAMRYLILHGLALIALAPQLRTPAQRIATAAVMLGALTFSGALALSAFWPTAGVIRAAPFGGGTMILSWLALGVALVLQRR